jgi:excisionase family DNA binding protein
LSQKAIQTESRAFEDLLESRAALRPDEVLRGVPLSRSALYKLLYAGEIPSIKAGRSRLIPVDGLRRWLGGQRSHAA